MNILKTTILGNDIKSKTIFIEKNFPRQTQEVEIGNREYKINLDYSSYKKNIKHKILSKKATQMNYRLYEGGGKAVYIIGIEDNGKPTGINLEKLILSIYFFNEIVNLSSANFNKIRIYNGNKGYIFTTRVSKVCKDYDSLLEF